MTAIKNFFNKVLQYFKTRGLGFYFLIPVVLFSFIVPFVYMGGFKGTPYFGDLAFALPFLVIALFALAFFKPTARYAPIAMFIMTMFCIFEFVDVSHMHIADTFFDGVTGNIFAQAGGPYSCVVIMFVLNLALCAAATFLKQFKEPKAIITLDEEASV